MIQPLLIVLSLTLTTQVSFAERYVLEKAEKHRLSGEYKLAEQEAKKLLDGADADDGEVHLFYSMMLAQNNGDRALIKKHIEEGLRLAPDSWRADDAKRYLRKMIDSEENPVPIVSNGGQGYTGLKIGHGGQVFGVIAGSPASKAGLLTGDRIESVDNVSTVGASFTSIANRIIGPIGTKVTLVIMRSGKRYTCIVLRDTPVPEEQRHLAMENQKPQPSAEHARTRATTLWTPPSTPTKTATTATATKTAANAAPASPKSSPQANKPIIPTIIPIEIFRKTRDSETIEREIRITLSAMPKHVQESIKSAGLTVLIVPYILAYKPEFATEKPRGYHGGSYENCRGMFSPSDKKIIVTERVSAGNHPMQLNPTAGYTTVHEIGHAFDSTGGYSSSEDFIKAYEDDGKYLGNEQRNDHEYFLQKDEAGRSEMFAELFTAICAPGVGNRAKALSKDFPRCTQIVKKYAE
ncbi:MAG: hypothetical protein IAF58_16835 [Leptolyngbya sp.]|nr:hypothetical protein [Candidatus Melainabacteria bacterium]